MNVSRFLEAIEKLLAEGKITKDSEVITSGIDGDVCVKVSEVYDGWLVVAQPDRFGSSY